jgi:hypothetical protein
MRITGGLLKQDLETPILIGIAQPAYNFDSTPCPKRNSYRARIGMPEILKEATFVALSFYLLSYQYFINIEFTKKHLGPEIKSPA